MRTSRGEIAASVADAFSGHRPMRMMFDVPALSALQRATRTHAEVRVRVASSFGFTVESAKAVPLNAGDSVRLAGTVMVRDLRIHIQWIRLDRNGTFTFGARATSGFREANSYEVFVDTDRQATYKLLDED